jgi:hypothetical protein
MAIDSQIQDRVDAYRGNPQALQQRYAQSQELMDLLAMQKMKSEKEAYARDMQLKADNQPKTIAQQYESDLVAKTKDEMLKGVQGVMANEQNKKQKNINKAAEVGVAPVGNTNPAIANTGVAAAPQGGMMKLAGGGIIGFANEGEVKSPNKTREEQIDLLRKKYNANLISKSEYEQQAAQIRSKAPNSPGALAAYKKADDLFFATSKNRQDDQNRSTVANKNTQSFNPSINYEDKVDDKTGENMPVGAQQLATEVDNFEGAGLGKLPAPNFGVPGGGLEGLLAKPTEKVDTVNPVDPTKKPIVPDVVPPEVTSSGTGNFGIEDIAYGGTKVPEGVQNIDRQTQEGITSLLTENKDRTAFTNEMMADRRKLRAELEDKLKNRGLMASLAGAQGSSLGSTMRTSALAGMAADKEGDALKTGEFDAINKLGMDEFNKLADIKEKGVAQGRQYSKDEKAFAQAEAGQIYDANKQNQSAAAKVAEIKSKEFVSKQDNKVKIDIANMEKEIAAKKNSIAERSNEIRATGDLINADILIIKETEALVNMAQKNIGASYDKLILSVNDNVIPPIKTSEEKKIEVQRLQTLKTKLIEERTLQLQNDALQARKRLAKREGMGNKPSGSNTSGFITGSMKVS